MLIIEYKGCKITQKSNDTVIVEHPTYPIFHGVEFGSVQVAKSAIDRFVD